MHAIAERARQTVERFLARSGNRNGRALGMERARDRAADRPASTCHQGSLAVEIEHQGFLPALKAATSSGLPIAAVVRRRQDA